MELSKPDLQIYDFSGPSASDSQVLGHSSSLLLPSEPPELGNWFPTYQYESPELETNDNFRDSISEESEFGKEKEENLRVFKEMGKKDEILVAQKLNSNGFSECGRSIGDDQVENQSLKLSENVDSAYSASLPSEPINVRNWFSSYVYESPTLDTADGFRDSLSKEGEFIVEESNREKAEDDEELITVSTDDVENSNGIGKNDKICEDNKQEKEYSNKNVDSGYSASLPSEPINVRNWFSSYVYESPTLDTADGFKDSLSKEGECEEDGFTVEETNREKAEDGVEFRRPISSDGVQNSNGPDNYDKTCEDQEKESSNKDDPNTGGSSQILSAKGRMCFGSALKKCSKYEMLQNHGTSPAKDVTLSNLDQEGTQCKPIISDEIRIVPLNVRGSLCSSSRDSSQKLIHRLENVKDLEAKGHIEAASFLSPQNNLHSVMVNGASTEKSKHGCDDKENNGLEISKDGFVTTRKGRFTMANEENLLEEPKQNKRGAILLACGKSLVVERKALAERTNLHLSGVTETTGKWQCPQKRKPNLGPPLKQLRLERWVKRL